MEGGTVVLLAGTKKTEQTENSRTEWKNLENARKRRKRPRINGRDGNDRKVRKRLEKIGKTWKNLEKAGKTRESTEMVEDTLPGTASSHANIQHRLIKTPQLAKKWGHKTHPKQHERRQRDTDSTRDKNKVIKRQYRSNCCLELFLSNYTQ